MRHRRRPLVLTTLLTLGALSTAMLVPNGLLAATSACDEGRWPARVQGQPATFAAGARAGDYLWHDPNGWHLRVTHPGSTRVAFSGRIVANAAMSASGVKLEPGDTFAFSADRKTLTYRFVNHGRIDGIDFRTACATRLAFNGAMAGVKLPVGRIWIGRAGLHPLQNPFVIVRSS